MTAHEREERFWAEVRRCAAEAADQELRDLQRIDADELEAAERALQEADRLPAAPLAPEQIDRIVHDAMAAVEVPVRMPGPVDGSLERRPANRARLGIARLLAAAAALCMTPTFVAAATVVTVATVASVMLRNTTKTLRFQDAVRQMVADRSPESIRNPALGTVHADLVWTIQVVQGLAHGVRGAIEPPLREAARAELQRVRAALHADDPFVLRPLPDDMIALVEHVEDAGRGADMRLRALRRLGELMVYGVSALKEIERAPPSERIALQTAAVLTQLAQFLD